jgi:hypothetical protein
MKNTLQGAGLAGVPTMHNLPFGEGSTPLDPKRVNQVVDLLGLDYYHVASRPRAPKLPGAPAILRCAPPPAVTRLSRAS